MSRLLDFIIGCLKWPVAILAVVAIPAMWQALKLMDFGNLRFFVFLGGAFLYFALKVVASSRSSVAMQTLAHEFTHTFFALLTFHRVTHIRLRLDDTGGSMAFRGKGNWLIVIAPYFFPLFLFLLMLGITFYSDRIPESWMINCVLGYFFAYHVESILVQIHGEQPDFKEVGFPFCILFLPGANLFACSIVLAFNNGGWTRVRWYLKVVYRLSERVIDKLL